jgi:Holliday junction DNA helicase RuvB
MIDIPTPTPEEDSLITSLRAQVWEEFIGQPQIKRSLQVAITAAKEREEALDHVLFYGPPGLGKTTLSHLIAKEMGSALKITSGTALTKVGDIAALLSNLEPGDVLFIDEIHRLPKVIEETLYPVMEDFALDIMIGKGPSSRSVRLDIPRFTLVGATTRFGALAGPFRDRFGLIHRVSPYEHQDLSQILQQAAVKLHTVLDSQSALELARRARGTPRVALQLLKRARDHAQLQKLPITPDLIKISLDLLAIDSLGLSEHDRLFLSTIMDKHRGGPVGLSTLAASLNEDPLTIEEIIEPYLLQLGFLQKTPKGRVVTPAAYGHLGVRTPII